MKFAQVLFLPEMCMISDSEAEPMLRVLSIATGTKCLSFSKLDAAGRLIHDSHAEVLARRGFLR